MNETPRSKWVVRGTLSVLLAAGCSAPAPRTSKPAVSIAGSAAPPAPVEIHERIALHTCTARARIAKVLGHDAAVTPADGPIDVKSSAAASSPPPTTSLVGSTTLAENEAYRAVAPGTVLIRTEQGYGSGVLIDAKGYVLTNYHVVANGRKTDFVISVDVDLGDITATGRMTRKEKSYEGAVVKVDPIRDMAIVKIKDPPEKLGPIKLAKSAPQVGEKVMAIGHAGVGFLWAAKSCGIASIGERQRDSSRLAGFECGTLDPSLSPEAAKLEKKRCEDRKKQMMDALQATTQGLAVQTDCAITHGDSGGPLVNMAGELVGLNQSVSADLATASFHVHLDEIRDFVSAYPEAGMPILPDPLCDGGDSATLEDIDLDGVPDALMTRRTTGAFSGYEQMSLLIDLDENDAAARAQQPSDAPFDAELALLVTSDGTYVWYDTDGDSRFDVLLSDTDKDGAPNHAYRLEADGRITADDEKLPKHDLSGRFVKDPELQARLGKIASAIGGAKYVSQKTLATASGSITIPDPALGAGTQGRLVDVDGNGAPDVAFMRGTFSSGALIDADEDSLGALKPDDPADDVVKAKKVDAEVVVVSQGSTMWALYDTDSDARFDLALMTSRASDPSALWTTNAWRLGASDAERTPALDQIGRKLLRPSLLSQPRAALSMRVLGSDLASDEGGGSLPNPYMGIRYRVREVKGAPSGSVVVDGSSYPWRTVLIDVDGDTPFKSGAKKPLSFAPAPPTAPTSEEVQKAISAGTFDAEVAIVQSSSLELVWYFYDTNADRSFDSVVVVGAGSDAPLSAYRLSSGAALTFDDAAVAGPPVRYKNFSDGKLGKKWRELATSLFSSKMIEP
ncbi:MAG: trypsin-like peptidase domain-containing protein [Polyangiaceae bacterium]